MCIFLSFFSSQICSERNKIDIVRWVCPLSLSLLTDHANLACMLSDLLFDRPVSCCEANRVVEVIFYLACIDLALTTFLEVK